MEIISCLLGQDRFRSGFSAAVKEFAFSLNYYSPRAYSYVHQKFNYNLPHPSTLRQWYAKSDANGEPGFCKAGLNCLTELVNDKEKNESDFFCSVVFDDIYIRHHVQYNDSQKNFLGFITYGHDANEPLPVATQAIVFLINGVNVPISIPVAHHYIAKLNSYVSCMSTVSEMNKFTSSEHRMMQPKFSLRYGTNEARCSQTSVCTSE